MINILFISIGLCNLQNPCTEVNVAEDEGIGNIEPTLRAQTDTIPQATKKVFVGYKRKKKQVDSIWL